MSCKSSTQVAQQLFTLPPGGSSVSFEVALFLPPLPRNIDVKQLAICNRSERQCFGGEGRGEGASVGHQFPLTLSLSPKNSDCTLSLWSCDNFRILGGEGTKKAQLERA